MSVLCELELDYGEIDPFLNLKKPHSVPENEKKKNLRCRV